MKRIGLILLMFAQPLLLGSETMEGCYEYQHSTIYEWEYMKIGLCSNGIFLFSSNKAKHPVVGNWHMYDSVLVLRTQNPQVAIIGEKRIFQKGVKFRYYDVYGNRDFGNGDREYVASVGYPLSILTESGDTLVLNPNGKKEISIGRGIKIRKVWIDTYRFLSKEFEIENEYNYFKIKVYASRQFEDEEWKIEPDGSLRPKDSRGRLADYVLKKYSEEEPDSMDFPINRIKRWAEKIKTDKRMSDIYFYW